MTVPIPRCKNYVTAANLYLGLDLRYPCEEARMRGLCALDAMNTLHDPLVLTAGRISSATPLYQPTDFSKHLFLGF